VLIIIDEFHELSRKDIIQFDKIDEKKTKMNTLLHEKNYRILFMSATPRVYDIENDEENDVCNYDDEIEIILGKTICKMSFCDAIKQEIICDYRIIIPSLTVGNNIEDLMIGPTAKRLYTEENLILPYMTNNINKIDLTRINAKRKLQSKCDFIMKCINEHGSRKTIIYCKNTCDLCKIWEEMQTVIFQEKQGIDKLWISSITSVLNDKERKIRLDNFASNKQRSILLSIRILDQSIDIPSCDSIVITGSFSNKIRTIQRLCRATRKDSNNRHKVAMLYAWCEESNEMLDLLSSMKEYDINLTEKISIVPRYDTSPNNSDKLKICKEIDATVRIIVGIQEYRFGNWYAKLKLVKEYIDKCGKRPSKTGKDKIIGNWLVMQQTNYKIKKYIMSNPVIYSAYTDFKTEYSEYF